MGIENQDSLQSLAYVSSATASMTDGALLQLLFQARQRNRTMGLTGMLLYAEDAFLQVLEGPRAGLEVVMSSIRHDPRHARIIVLREEPITERAFPDWKMGFRSVYRDDLVALEGFADLLEDESPLRESFERHPDASCRLLHAFSRSHGMVPVLEPDSY